MDDGFFSFARHTIIQAAFKRTLCEQSGSWTGFHTEPLFTKHMPILRYLDADTRFKHTSAKPDITRQRERC